MSFSVIQQQLTRLRILVVKLTGELTRLQSENLSLKGQIQELAQLQTKQIAQSLAENDNAHLNLSESEANARQAQREELLVLHGEIQSYISQLEQHLAALTTDADGNEKSSFN